MENNIYSPEYVRGLFNRMSSSYERMNFITSFGFSIRWRNQFIKNLNQPGRSVEVLDLLTGMGETWESIKRRLPDSRLTGLDFSDGMLKHALHKNEAKYNGEVVVLQQDVLSNTLPGNHYDFVICAFGLKTFNQEQLNQLALETKRILKCGGEFHFVEVSQPENKLLNFLYGFYLGKVIPVLGKLLLGGPEEYRMLWKYTRQFRNARQAADIFSNVGLKASFHSYFFGCATGISGTKDCE